MRSVAIVTTTYFSRLWLSWNYEAESWPATLYEPKLIFTSKNLFLSAQNLLTILLKGSCWKCERQHNLKKLDNEIDVIKRKQATEVTSVKICLIII